MRLTKHTTTSITAARLSMWTPTGKDPPSPRSIQFTENSMGCPPPGMMPATNSSAKTEKTSETVTPRMATYWAFSLRRRPVRARTKNTSAGSMGIAAMISCWPTVCICPPLSASHGVDFVHVHRPARAEHSQHDREPDRDLGGGDRDHQHGVAHPQPSRVRQVIGEGHEGQVDGVDHQLDAHEHHDRVAPNQGPPRPDGEHDRPHHQVALERRRGNECVQKLLRLRRDGRHYSSTPLSMPVPVLRRLTTIAATIATSSSTEATSKSKTNTSDPALTPSRSRPKAAASRGPLPALVDEDLERREHRGVEHDEEPCDPEERTGHEQRRVNDVAAEHHRERRDERHAGQEGERDGQAASSPVLGRSTVLGASFPVGFFFFLTAGLGSTVGSTGRSPNCLASSRRL